MIIDAHCHAGRGTGLTGPWDTRAAIEPFLRRSRAAGIARTIVLPPFHDDYEVANGELARVVRAHPGRLIGFAAVNPKRDRGRIARLVELAVRRYGFRGLKVHAADHRLSREACDAAARFRLPMIYDVFGKPAPIDLIAPEYRSVAFIIPHLGSFGDDYRAHAQVIDLIARHPNVFTDTSGVRRFDYLVEAVRRAGPRKIIFGSDGPWLHPGLELQKIRLLGLARDAEEAILGGNIRRLLARVRVSGGRSPAAPALSVNGTGGG